MADGRQWTTANLNLDTRLSYCYGNSAVNCDRYGRLYTWEAAREGCHLLGSGWRLPTDGEWREMAKHYGGIGGDSTDGGKAAFAALMPGGRSGFDARLGGNRSAEGEYQRLDAHGFYWTASDSGASIAPFYNFGRGGQALNRQGEGDKRMAVSVRCVKD